MRPMPYALKDGLFKVKQGMHSAFFVITHPVPITYADTIHLHREVAAINNRIFSPVVGGLKVLGFGQAAGTATPIRTDETGQTAVSATGTQAAITTTDPDIRALSAESGSSSASASDSDT